MRIAAISLTFILAGCGTEPSPDSPFARIRTDGSHYAQFDALEVTVTNIGSHRIALSGCGMMEREGGAGWSAVAGPIGSCTRLVMLPGDLYVARLSSIGAVPVGKARVTFPPIEILDSFVAGAPTPVVAAHSNHFTVTPGNAFGP